MHALRKVLDRLLAVACVLLFAILVITVSWQVFTRQVLDDPSGWSEALAKYLFVWLGMFGAALVFSERGHIAVEFVVGKFSEGTQRLVAVFVQLTIIAFAVLALIWGGTRIVLLTWGQSLTALPGQMGPVYLVMPITGAIITFYAIYHVMAVLRGEEAPVEAGDQTETIEGQ